MSRPLSMRRVLPHLSFGDARTVIAGILGALGLAFVVLQQTQTEARLFRFLRQLPPSTRAVVMEASNTEIARTPRIIVDTLLGSSPVSLPPGVHALATVLLEDSPGTIQRVVLIDRSAARRASVSGLDVGGLTAVGEGSELLRGDGGGSAIVPSTVLRFLRASEGIRVLVEASWLARRFPLLPIPSTQQFLALDVRGDPQHLHLTGVMPTDHGQAPGAGGPLLTIRPPNTFLVLDGIPVSALIPAELPPLLEALRDGSGVATELRTLTDALQTSPLTLVLQTHMDGTVQGVVGFEVAKTVDVAVVETMMRALLARRLAITHAVVETVRSNGRIIRHTRPRGQKNDQSSDAPAAVEETSQESWKMLRAPKAAGTTDLVAAFRDRHILLGTSTTSVLQVGSALRPSATADAMATVFVDGALLRRVPAVTLALRGLTPDVRQWIDVLETLSVDLSADARTVRFDASVHFSSPR